MMEVVHNAAWQSTMEEAPSLHSGIKSKSLLNPNSLLGDIEHTSAESQKNIIRIVHPCMNC